MSRVPILACFLLLACSGLQQLRLPVTPVAPGGVEPGVGALGGAMARDLETIFERSGGRASASYAEGMAYYRRLADVYPEIRLLTRGPTDAGVPLSLVLFSSDREFDLRRARAAGKSLLLINNAIHPGEPDGVDASMLLLRDIAQRKLLPEEAERVLIAVIPYYNIAGALNRNSTTRANQDGPEAYGFRGSARNYDLNRDFIKSDTPNARSFAQIFHELDPDLFIDTHVSNGADYQHVMTLAYTQKDKLGGALGQLLDRTLLPYLYGAMRVRDSDAIPYVNVEGETPDKGWVQFMDWPRYSSGYAALFQTPGMMSETHMLKPYAQRVNSTQALLTSAVAFLAEHGQELRRVREQTRRELRTQPRFALSWKPDLARPTPLRFKGYEARRIRSKVTSGDRLFYDRTKPYEQTVDYFDNYVEDVVVTRPKAYVFSQTWSAVAELLALNGVQVRQLEQDESFEIESYTIESYSTAEQPFEGHYPHDDVQVSVRRERVALRAGDYYVACDQDVNRYIVETLEPQGRDSFFRWNFFDTVLQQKESYSSYVFEDIAERLLAQDGALREAFQAQLRSDAAFAKNPRAQLNFIYQRSPHHEAAHRRYPVYRVVD
jgi:hypothetical protein